MKKNLKFWNVWMGIFILVCACTACSDDDSVPAKPGQEQGQVIQQVPQAVALAFGKKFPNATNVAWKERKGYYVASFGLKSQGRAEAVTPLNLAWFQMDGTFNMSEVEISVFTLEADYAAVMDAWEASTYCADGFTIDDVDLLQRAGSSEAIVKIDVEKGKEEYDLFFTLEGLLVKAVSDTDAPDAEDDDDNLPCPAELLKWVEAKYPKAVLVDFEQDSDKRDLQYEVTVLTTLGTWKVEKELVFNKDYHFLYAEVDFDDRVLAVLIQKLLTPEKMEKLVELTGEANPMEWDIEIIENEKELYTISVEDKNDKRVELVKDFDPSLLTK